MAIRLWNQSTTELHPDNSYSRAMKRRAETVLGNQVTVDCFGVPAGSYGGGSPSASIGNAFVFHKMLSRFIDNAIQAEREGYDGFVIGSFSEPFLTEIRAAVDIPVTSVTETSLLVGCTLGQRIAMVTTSPNVVGMIQRSLALHQMGARVSTVVSVTPALQGPVLHDAFEEPAPALERFERAAREALVNGADVLVPAEGILSVLLADRGVTRFENAPVIDVFGVTWSYALMLANLRSTIGLATSRRGRYEQPNQALLEALRRQ
jgi:allantoin racemase